VYRRYKSGPMTLPWGAPAFTGEFCVFIFNLDKEVSAMQVGFSNNLQGETAVT
jgi:hypothetical protein